MERENTNQDSRYLVACENVKKIVNAIKTIKVKYYTNFARISDEDKEIYEQLSANLEKISEENDLVELKEELMGEVSAKYDRVENAEDIRNGNSGGAKEPNTVDLALSRCIGAVDVQVKELANGKIKKAKQCQDILKEYLAELDKNCIELVTNYKRRKFGDLIRSKAEIEEKKKVWMDSMKDYYKEVGPEEIHEALNQVQLAQKDSKALFDGTKTKEEDTEVQIG